MVTHPTPTAPDATAAAATLLLLAGLRVDVAAALGDLTAVARMVDNLTDTRQRRLGFLTPAGEDALNDLYAKERRDRERALREGQPVGTGDVAAPGNFAAIAVSAEIWATLQHQIRRCARHLTTRGVCSVHPLRSDEPTVIELARVLGHQVMAVTTPALLQQVLDDLTHLEAEAQRFIDAAESSTRINADCPHCGRRTLVARFHENLIRCERDPRSHHYEPCVCSDPICECKTRPTSHRHEWHRPRPGAPSPSWYALRDRLNLTRITKEPHP